MSLYSVDKLIEETRRLAAEYRRTMGKPLPGVSNEIAEYDAARCLGLDLCRDRSEGYDAIAGNDRRVQIKGRTIFDERKSGQRIGQLKVDKQWDSVVLVLMDEDYASCEMYEADRDEVLEYIDSPSAGRKKRGAMSVARFKIIGRLVWTREHGLEEDRVQGDPP